MVVVAVADHAPMGLRLSASWPCVGTLKNFRASSGAPRPESESSTGGANDRPFGVNRLMKNSTMSRSREGRERLLLRIVPPIQNLPHHDGIAFARCFFQLSPVDNLDIAAAVGDESGLL